MNVPEQTQILIQASPIRLFLIRVPADQFGEDADRLKFDLYRDTIKISSDELTRGELPDLNSDELTSEERTLIDASIVCEWLKWPDTTNDLDDSSEVLGRDELLRRLEELRGQR